MQPVVFRNNLPILIWAFAAAWMLMLSVMTALTGRGGGPPLWVWGVLALFWVVGLALSALALRTPCTHLEVSPAGVLLEERFLSGRRQSRFSASEVSVEDITESGDEGGGVIYTCAVALPGKRRVMFAQARSRERILEQRAHMITALQRAGRAS
jgi:hypothetical protein